MAQAATTTSDSVVTSLSELRRIEGTRQVEEREAARQVELKARRAEEQRRRAEEQRRKAEEEAARAKRRRQEREATERAIAAEREARLRLEEAERRARVEGEVRLRELELSRELEQGRDRRPWYVAVAVAVLLAGAAGWQAVAQTELRNRAEDRVYALESRLRQQQLRATSRAADHQKELAELQRRVQLAADRAETCARKQAVADAGDAAKKPVRRPRPPRTTAKKPPKRPPVVDRCRDSSDPLCGLDSR